MEIFLELHRRQFVISARRFEREGWQHIPLGPDRILSHHPDLTVTRRGPDVILGTWLLEGQAGRFVRISDGMLEGDASCLLSVYYGKGPEGPVISSSPALAGALLGLARDPRVPQWRKPLKWYIPPGSPFLGLTRLLHDQRLLISDLSLIPRSRQLGPMASVDIAVRTLADHLVANFRALPEERIILALTAGQDSRVLFAALVASGRRFETITQMVDERSRTDVEVAARLSKRFGIRHSTILPRMPEDHAAFDLWQQHCAASYADADGLLVPRGQYGFLGKGDILLRGGCFEIGRRVLHNKMGDLDVQSATAEQIWLREVGATSVEGADAQSLTSLRAWLDWRRIHDTGLDLTDSYQLEHRIGGWLGSIEQAMDCLPARSLQPASSDVVLAATMTAENVSDRQAGFVQREAARYLCPDALRIPINPVPLRTRLRRSLHQLIKGR